MQEALIRPATPEEAKINNGIILMVFYHGDHSPRTIGPFETDTEALQEASNWGLETTTKLVYGKRMLAEDSLNEAQISHGRFSVAEFGFNQRRRTR